MATLNYRDPATQQWVAVPVYTGSAGSPGPAGPTGPAAVSADVTNTAVLGTDGEIFVPAGGLDPVTATALYVDVLGDAMTGELLVPDQVAVNPTDPLTAAARGYVDQVVTVALLDPDPVVDAPKRDGQAWFVVEDVVVSLASISLTYDAGTAGFTVSGAYTVDWGDGSPVEDAADGARSEHVYTAPATCKIVPQAGSDLTSFVQTLSMRDPTGIVFDTPGLKNLSILSVAAYTVTTVEFVQPVVLDSCAGLFKGSRSLVSVTGSIGAVGTDFSEMFNGCYKLTTAPAIDTSNGTNFAGMYSNCKVLTTAPAIDTSNGTNFAGMYGLCYKLTTAPAIDTSSGTNFETMYNACWALTTVPLHDTSNGTNFSAMFMECIELTTVPPFDTSSGTNFSTMFMECTALQTVPLFDTSSGTNFSWMFYGCSGLLSVPLFDTSSGTNFANTLTLCSALTSVPAWDMSNGTDFGSMFVGANEINSILAFGFRYKVMLADLRLDASSLNTFFTNLGTADNTAAQQDVYIIGNPGMLTCDQSIATAKGWTVTG